MKKIASLPLGASQAEERDRIRELIEAVNELMAKDHAIGEALEGGHTHYQDEIVQPVDVTIDKNRELVTPSNQLPK